MKTKKTKTKSIRSRKPKQKNYQAQYLVLILAVVLLLEGAVFNMTVPADWNQAAKVLDISTQVSKTENDLSIVFQPMIETVQNVDTFYQLAAIEMMRLLDLSDSGFGSEVSFIYNGVSEFYNQASMQMVSVLDASDQVQAFGPIVAGISISR